MEAGECMWLAQEVYLAHTFWPLVYYQVKKLNLPGESTCVE